MLQNKEDCQLRRMKNDAGGRCGANNQSILAKILEHVSSHCGGSEDGLG